MPRQQNGKLSARTIARLCEPGHHSDGNGLYLHVAQSTKKSWYFRFKIAGRAREMVLGSLDTLDLVRARAKACECRQLVLDGKDPLEERRASKAAAALEQARQITFNECAASYIAAHRTSWRNPKHVIQWENTIATYASPVIGHLEVASVDAALVVKVLGPIWKSKTNTAALLRGRIEAILDWAKGQTFRDGDNPARWSGHLENLLPNPRKVTPVQHSPALPWTEISTFLKALAAREGLAARATEFAILTACRTGEVRGATWDEIDIDRKLWTIPAERMKAGREHRVPLSSAAVALLASIARDSAFVFHGRDSATPLSDMSLTAVLRRMGRGDITVHGFRSTFRDWCAEYASNAFSREVCEHALAHSLPDKVEAAYRRGDLLDKRTLLMQAWSDYCQGIVT